MEISFHLRCLMWGLNRDLTQPSRLWRLQIYLQFSNNCSLNSILAKCTVQSLRCSILILFAYINCFSNKNVFSFSFIRKYTYSQFLQTLKHKHLPITLLVVFFFFFVLFLYISLINCLSVHLSDRFYLHFLYSRLYLNTFNSYGQ